ncbi:ribosomal protein S18-alanine N-acetyltransferase [Sutterella sp.]|uniref:ribosomal protein S18-alanine N-acetyltransferase n=1 Tax=Sutterella sp. TaxID=1981025 RepID=UPI0026E10ECC|nr:ribosomal protein S18-alanine N-acetyltransferase [Sutterella sp.]MDO5533013.1 ribosomal protein S18-alanine N-acetyltransferase [Sutterella sp.]
MTETLLSAADEIRLRPMCEADLATLARLEGEVEASPWSEGNFRDSLGSGHTCLVLEAPDGIVAWAVVMGVLDEAELLIIGVRKSAQRRGLGRRLLAALVDDLRKRSFTRFFLEVRAGNVPAIGLYKSFGFEKTGLRRGYYPAAVPGAPREDALLMALDLTAEPGAAEATR